MVKVVLLGTSPRDSMCGIADYTMRLASAFEGLGISVALEFPLEWSIGAVTDLSRKYKQHRDTVFHLQYPSLFMGNSLSPALLPVLLPNLFTTMHEFRIFSLPRKMIFASHALLAKKIIFSNDGEREIFRSWFPCSRSRLDVIPIGNNIARVRDRPERTLDKLVYFGQISRNKGIELFMETVSHLRNQGVQIDIGMIGAVTDKDPDFLAFVSSAVQKYHVTQYLDLSPEDVSRQLNEATVALLPFPDGISDKRGSALAALDHDVTVLTTHSANTPEWLRSTTHRVISSEDAAAVIGQLLRGSLPRQPAADIVKHKMLARNWTQIALKHLLLYEAALVTAAN